MVLWLRGVSPSTLNSVLPPLGPARCACWEQAPPLPREGEYRHASGIPPLHGSLLRRPPENRQFKRATQCHRQPRCNRPTSGVLWARALWWRGCESSREAGGNNPHPELTVRPLVARTCQSRQAQLKSLPWASAAFRRTSGFSLGASVYSV